MNLWKILGLLKLSKCSDMYPRSPSYNTCLLNIPESLSVQLWSKKTVSANYFGTTFWSHLFETTLISRDDTDPSAAGTRGNHSLSPSLTANTCLLPTAINFKYRPCLAVFTQSSLSLYVFLLL